MFFNKLKEEMQNWVYVKLAKLEEKFMQRVADAIKAANQTPEELIKKYKHTQWYDVSRLVTAILEDRFNLAEAIPLATYKGNKTVYSINGYVGDTLKDAYEKELKEWEEKYLPKRRLKEYLQEEKIYTPPSKEKVALAKIKAIASNQKSTVKAVKEIKEVLKDVE